MKFFFQMFKLLFDKYFSRVNELKNALFNQKTTT